MKKALSTAILVAKASCARAQRGLTAASVGTALALMLGIAGCTSSHAVGGTDADGDGYTDDVDCDDSNADVYPGAPEPPSWFNPCEDSGRDFDCDGVPVYWSCNPIWDADMDGFGADVDCDDSDPTIYPGAPEDECEPGPDRNCDGVPPGAACNPIPDADGDGYDATEDCDDGDPNIFPGAMEEVCPDGVDNDCDGHDGVDDPTIFCAPADADEDGYPRYYDCDDSNPDINPGVMEWDCPDGVDQDCDGVDGQEGLICNGMADVAPSDCVPS